MKRRILKDPKYELDIRWSPEDRCYVVSVRELPGCMSHGRTLEEAVAMAREAICAYVESLEARGLPVPQPFAERRLSGRIPLRIDPVLHRDLTVQARTLGLSLNRFIEQKLRQRT